MPPPGRRRRPRRPGPDRGRAALRRRDDVLGAGLRAGPAPRCATSADPIPHTRLGQARRPRRGLPGHRPAARRLRRRHLRRPAHRHAARHPGARSWSARRCTPRCGSTPRCRTTCGRCAGRGVHDRRRPRRAAWPAATSGRAAWPTRPTSSPPSSGVLAPPRPRRPRTCSSPPAAPASRSTRCASSATARRASRATPSPRRPPPGAPRSPWSPPSTGRSPPASRSSGSRPRPRWRRPCWPAPTAADVVVMAAAVADFRPGRRRPTSKIKKADGRARGRPRADRRHPRRPRRAQAARPDAGRLRRRDRRRAWPTPPSKLARKGLDLIVANDVSRARASASSTTPTQVTIVSAGGVVARGRAGRQAGRRRARCSTPSWPTAYVCRPALTAPRHDRSTL